MAYLQIYPASAHCYSLVFSLLETQNLTYQGGEALKEVCYEIQVSENYSHDEDEYSKPMVLIGIYISIASLICILAIALDLLYGFRNRKFWFPTKYFSLNAASVTVITVAMKLPVDLSSPMLGKLDQVAKIGSLAFMCTIMSNFMPSLASMGNNSLLANVIGLSILVFTLIGNVFIQIRTCVISTDTVYERVTDIGYIYIDFRAIAYMYMGMLFFLLIILISSAITLPTSKKILESKYQSSSNTTLNDENPPKNPIEKLRQLVKIYWVMAETGNPQFVMASNPLSSASGIICAINMVMYILLVWRVVLWYRYMHEYSGIQIDQVVGSVYKWSVFCIVITQSIGIVVGSGAPMFRCFTILSFKSFSKQNKKHFLVFKVEKYWTQNLCDWKEGRISFSSSGCRSRALLHNLKTLILSFCIGFQKVIVVSCKIIGLIPIVVIIFVVYCSYYFKSLKALLFTPPPSPISDDIDEDLSNYVLLHEDNMRLAKKAMKGISDSMNHLIQNAEKKQHNNLLKLLEKSVAFDGVEAFDTDQVQSILSVEPDNNWSLPVISLTCIAIAIPNIDKEKVDNLVRSVGEGLLYTHLVETNLNKDSAYLNIRRATARLWHEVKDHYKWLETTLKRSAYEGKMPIEIVKHFAQIAEDILNEFKISTNGELVEKENLPPKIIIANSMYQIAKTIIHTHESYDLEITEEELFTRLSNMIADILAACLTNIPRVIIMKCRESVIEKREASVKVAIDLLGQTTEIIKSLEMRELPNMGPDRMVFIDEWRLHLKQP